ncbi:unnamed protein product [Zymoseptoria tritici ST99CH_1A5]|uniref:Uncharacterized protein n=1 Tax=Zymoseptoria tritici ST99CH_1A5 TaxID=1276529 RepID=A0A1Y6L2H1_ZYMTR|nr:unnamed protein product [Zymoseptoria tritici ST99CH_1A5]
MQTTWRSVCVATSLLPLNAAAQTAGTQEGGLTSPTTDLTITFSPGTLDDCASPSTDDNAGGITFTTASTPIQNYCFNLEDLFLGPANANITQNVSRVSTLSSGGLRSFQDGSYNFTYALSNQESYDPALNYSHIFYSQPASGAPPGYGTAGLPTDASARLVNLFWDRDCVSRRNASAPEDQQEVPRYRYSCMSEGQCDVVAYSVQSFLIGDVGWRYNQAGNEGECFDFDSGGEVVGVSGLAVGILVVLQVLVVYGVV